MTTAILQGVPATTLDTDIWLGRQIRVLPLQRIIASKRHIRRPKDIA
jgi:hypothetical protein